jgi:hypothetical protein
MPIPQTNRGILKRDGVMAILWKWQNIILGNKHILLPLLPSFLRFVSSYIIRQKSIRFNRKLACEMNNKSCDV